MRKEQFIKNSSPHNTVASVIILPGGSVDGALIELVSKWTSAWLLKPAFWVTVNQISQSNQDSPKVMATVIGRNGHREVDFIQYLSRLSLSCINLIAVRVVEEDSKFNVEQDRVVDLVADYVEKSRPISVGRELESNAIQLVKVNLVFAPSEKKGASAKDLYEPTWESNLVVAGEDRRTPTRLDGFLRYSEGERLNAFMLSNIASAAGIWSGQKKGIFEIIADNADLSPMHGLVRIMRVYVRGIISDGLSLRVAAMALKRAANANTSRIESRAFENRSLVAHEENQIDKKIETMVECTLKLQNGDLDYKKFEFNFQLDQKEISVKSAIRSFLINSWSLLKVLPIWIFAAIWNFIARVVTLKLFGSRGKEVVRGTIDFPQTDLDARTSVAIDEIYENREKVAKELADWPENVLRRAAPGLWAEMCSLILGNLDGSQLPTNFSHEKNDAGSIKVIGDLNLILPSLSEKWQLPIGIMRTLDSERNSATWREMDVLIELREFLLQRQKDAIEDKKFVSDNLAKVNSEVNRLQDLISANARKLERVKRGLPEDELQVAEVSS